MVCAAAGYAVEGYMPFVSTFALFGAGRAYEQIRNSVAYDGLNVKFGLSHSGLCVGEDGGSHQAIEDIALMRVIPGMTVLVPCDPIEMKKAVFAAAEIDGPVYIRVARPVCECITNEDDPFVRRQSQCDERHKRLRRGAGLHRIDGKQNHRGCKNAGGKRRQSGSGQYAYH